MTFIQTAPMSPPTAQAPEPTTWAAWAPNTEGYIISKLGRAPAGAYGRRRWQSSRPSCIAGPLSRRGRPARAGGRVSAGSRRVRKHNRERGPCRPTASPSAGPGVRRFWLPAIDSRIRGKSLSQEPCFLAVTRKEGNSPMCQQPRCSHPLVVVVYIRGVVSEYNMDAGTPPARAPWICAS